LQIVQIKVMLKVLSQFRIQWNPIFSEYILWTYPGPSMDMYHFPIFSEFQFSK
jgi:hypothetical protein